MSNPIRILETFDKNLTLPAEITLFGRAALALGYAQAPAHFHNTHDVDGILPMTWLESLFGTRCHRAHQTLAAKAIS